MLLVFERFGESCRRLDQQYIIFKPFPNWCCCVVCSCSFPILLASAFVMGHVSPAFGGYPDHRLLVFLYLFWVFAV